MFYVFFNNICYPDIILNRDNPKILFYCYVLDGILSFSWPLVFFLLNLLSIGYIVLTETKFIWQSIFSIRMNLRK